MKQTIRLAIDSPLVKRLDALATGTVEHVVLRLSGYDKDWGLTDQPTTLEVDSWRKAGGFCEVYLTDHAEELEFIDRLMQWPEMPPMSDRSG